MRPVSFARVSHDQSCDSRKSLLVVMVVVVWCGVVAAAVAIAVLFPHIPSVMHSPWTSKAMPCNYEGG